MQETKWKTYLHGHVKHSILLAFTWKLNFNVEKNFHLQNIFVDSFENLSDCDVAGLPSYKHSYLLLTSVGCLLPSKSNTKLIKTSIKTLCARRSVKECSNIVQKSHPISETFVFPFPREYCLFLGSNADSNIFLVVKL